jgi:RNA polymerase sigma-70 factor, ECF subfamily
MDPDPILGVGPDWRTATRPCRCETASDGVAGMPVAMTEPNLLPAEALPDWVVGHYDDLYRYAYRLTGNSVDAEDLAQQSFLVALRKRDQLRDVAKALPWLKTVLRNEFLQNLRRSVPSNVDDLSSVVDRTVTHEAGLDAREQRDELQRALAELAEEFRVPLLMFHIEELTYREIAEALNIPAGTVMSRISRARAALRQVLGEGTRSRGGPQVDRPVAPGPANDSVWVLRTV